MSRARSSDTKPELFVRRIVFSMGYRYRLHGRIGYFTVRESARLQTFQGDYAFHGA